MAWEWIAIASGDAALSQSLEVGQTYLLRLQSPVVVPDYLSGPIATAVRATDITLSNIQVMISGGQIDIQFTKAMQVTQMVSLWIIVKVVFALTMIAGASYTLFQLKPAIQAVGQAATNVATAAQKLTESTGGGLLVLGLLGVALFIISRR